MPKVLPRKSTYPEYRLELSWRADKDGQCIHTRLYRGDEFLQDGLHSTLDLHEALEAAMTNFFEGQ